MTETERTKMKEESSPQEQYNNNNINPSDFKPSFTRMKAGRSYLKKLQYYDLLKH